MNRLLLINPCEQKSGVGSYRSTTIPPLNLAYVAALTPIDRYQVRIVDENIEPLTNWNADIVGITAYSAHARKAYDIAKKFRSRGTPVIMGGIHASMVPDESLAYCDSVVIGEADNVWRQVLNDFERDALKPTYQGPPANLEKLVFPNRDILKARSYRWDAIQTSRGCPMDCSFCSVTQFNGHRYRRRPVDEVIRELDTLNKKFVLFLDDNILGHDSDGWLFEFFQRMVDKKLNKLCFAQTSLNFGKDKKLLALAYKAGLRVVLVGIESINHDSLAIYNKRMNAALLKKGRYQILLSNIRSAGIAVLGCFMLGSDEDTLDSFRHTLNFVRENRIDILQITKPTPLPGTQFFDKLYEAGRILDTNYPDAWRNYRFSRMLFKPNKLTIREVYEGFFYIRKNYYSYPEMIRRAVRTLVDTRSISSTLLAAFFNHTYRNAFTDSEIYDEYKYSANNE